MIRSDLHLHTTFSDGDLTPGEVVAAASELGYAQIAVTDHDTIGGVAQALEAAGKLGIEVIPGIEITVRFLREYFTGSLHLLVYFSEELLENEAFVSQLEGIVSKGRGLSLVEARVNRINQEFGPGGKNPMLDSPLTVESITSLAENVSRRHFAMALSSVHHLNREQVSMLIGNRSPAYVPSGVDLQLLKPLFRKWPVLPVLAHPAAGSFPGESHYSEVLPPFSTVVRVMPEFLATGLRGLEVVYPGHTESDQEKLRNFAVSLGLVITGGSDCHDTKDRPMGAAGLSEPLDFSELFR